MATTSTGQLVLVTGVTGKQGGAVARHLLARGYRVRGMTRKPESDAARVATAAGVQIVAGDLDDAASVGRAVEGVWGVFGVQNTWEAGVQREEEQGKRLARVARERGVRHFVYTSVGSAHRKTGVPHFDNKWRIEETVRSLGFPSHAVLRPVFFMENLLSPWVLQGDRLVAPMSPATSLQMVAVDDVGRFAALLFDRAADLSGTALDLAGDSVTMPAAAEVLSRSTGRNIEFVRTSIAEARKASEDAAAMYEWFDRAGYDADIDGLPRKYGLRPKRLAEWAAEAAKR